MCGECQPDKEPLGKARQAVPSMRTSPEALGDGRWIPQPVAGQTEKRTGEGPGCDFGVDGEGGTGTFPVAVNQGLARLPGAKTVVYDSGVGIDPHRVTRQQSPDGEVGLLSRS